MGYRNSSGKQAQPSDTTGRITVNHTEQLSPGESRQMRAERVAIAEHTERRILERSMRQAFRQTRDPSPRQLPTDHDYAVSTREYQSDQPSQKLLDRLLALSSPNPVYDRHRKATGNRRLFLLRSVFRNGPRRQGFASPRQPGAPLTAPGRSKLSCLRRKSTKRKISHDLVLHRSLHIRTSLYRTDNTIAATKNQQCP